MLTSKQISYNQTVEPDLNISVGIKVDTKHVVKCDWNELLSSFPGLNPDEIKALVLDILKKAVKFMSSTPPTVSIICFQSGYEDHEVYKVFSTKELADQYYKEHPHSYLCDVEEHEVL